MRFSVLLAAGALQISAIKGCATAESVAPPARSTEKRMSEYPFPQVLRQSKEDGPVPNRRNTAFVELGYQQRPGAFLKVTLKCDLVPRTQINGK